MELQAAATDDAIVLSLGNPQTFDLEQLPRFLTSRTVGEVLEQALLGSPMFGARWRWNATRSLAVLRSRGKGRVPFPIQRMQSDDLLAAAFPEQAACQENVTYPIEIPDHPLVATDHARLPDRGGGPEGARSRCWRRIESGRAQHGVPRHGRAVAVRARDPERAALRVPRRRAARGAPHARGVAAPRAAGRRARPGASSTPAAIAQVREEAAPDVARRGRAARAALRPRRRARGGPARRAGRARRAVRGAVARPGSRRADAPRVFALENARARARALPRARARAGARAARRAGEAQSSDAESALDAGRARPPRDPRARRPRPSSRRASASASCPVESALARLEGRGVAVRGRFEPELGGEQFCERSLLARIHRYTLARLRREIEPVSARVYLRFLLEWQHLAPGTQLAGEGGLLAAIESTLGLRGRGAARGRPSSCPRASTATSRRCSTRSVCRAPRRGDGCRPPSGERGTQPSRLTPICVFPRAELDELLQARPADAPRGARPARPGRARARACCARAARCSRARSRPPTRLLPVQLEEGLRELVAQGLVSCDGFAPLRRLLGPSPRRDPRRRPGRARVLPSGLPTPEGRWHLLARARRAAPDADELAESFAWRLLRRYGVVFRDLIAREWLPDALAPGARRAAPARGARARARRPLRQRLHRRAVRAGRSDPAPAPRCARAPTANEIVRVSASDPLNLVGVLTPGPARARGPHALDHLPRRPADRAEDRDGRTELRPARRSDASRRRAASSKRAKAERTAVSARAR